MAKIDFRGSFNVIHPSSQFDSEWDEARAAVIRPLLNHARTIRVCELETKDLEVGTEDYRVAVAPFSKAMTADWEEAAARLPKALLETLTEDEHDLIILMISEAIRAAIAEERSDYRTVSAHPSYSDM